MADKQLNQVTLHLIYQAMIYVANKEGIELEEKHEKLYETILNATEYSVIDMIDNLDNVYNLINQDELE